ncbi:putative outer membrane protein [Pedobacter sp. BAL39]|uniref:SusC/RagA family TonB-linked outer membrane protein n=1 Tax=Pedobacter sp. BAL39 TaxID=391596 RepID=UPI000155A2BA|nr:TonB-dependent receptor [Pedobacter sp. BAL39]EDM34029.1 putative outer membrane protein [Pedobacter sp. BAL39]
MNKKLLQRRDTGFRLKLIGNIKDRMLSFLLMLFLFTCAGSAKAQEKITGTVKDAGGPMVGVGVQLKGTGVSTLTDGDGRFSITLPAGQKGVLVFSFIGYTTKEVPVSGTQPLQVTLVESSSDLSEVVVVGYGTQRKQDLTGAISVVKATDVKKRQATTVAESLQGLATGIRVRGGGQAGSEAQIQIRGLKNFSGTNPLYVIDGLVTTANRDFNPADIESIQILKDASAAAIYGSRAANGVIIITTKRGAEGPTKIDVSAKTTLQTIPRYDLAKTEEFSRLNFMAYDNAGATRQNLDLSVNTDWQDEAFRVGQVQDYSMSFSGGSKDATYFISAGYFGNKGAVISTDFDRINFRVNTKSTKGIFTIGENLAISNAKTDEMSGNPIIDVVRMLPTIPVYNSANPGGYGYGDEGRARTFGSNPVAIADLDDRTNENLRIRGNLFSELQFLPSLKYRISLGYETSRDHFTYLRKEGNWTLNQAYDPAIFNENRGESSTALIENTLSFTETFGKHNINVLAGQSYQRDNYAQIWGRKRNILANPAGGYYEVLDQGNEPQTGGFKNRTDLISYFGRFEYNYADKYLVNGVIRTDGVSRFGKDHKFGVFPSISGAWRISQEEFFKTSWINDLKLRANYGTLGSSNIGPYDYIAFINTFPTIVMGPGQAVQPGSTQVQLANPDLRWEEVTQQNYGFDATVLDNKLTISAEYFISKTKDVLLRYPLLTSTGNDGGNPYVNGATLGNRGFEFTATYQENSNPFKYSVTGNLTTLRNKVIDLGYGKNRTFVGNTVTEVGRPIGMWYVLQTDGLFQNAAEVANYKNAAGKVIQPTAQPGDIRFKDNNGDGAITNADKVIAGNPWADYELGLNFNASYKDFTFSMDWFASFGSLVFNGPRSVTDMFSDNTNYRAGIQPWTPENPNTDVPRAFYGSTINSRGDTDRWLENGSFARMKYIGISYNLPDDLMKKIGFRNAQVTLSGQNLITITKYSGLDPEFSNNSIFEKGYDFGAFPNLRMVSVGLQFGF